METKPACTCPHTDCKEHGICCQCIAKHNLRNSMVHCVFPENTGDRSKEAYYAFLKSQFESQ